MRRSGAFIVSFEHISYLFLSSVSIVDFEQVIADSKSRKKLAFLIAKEMTGFYIMGTLTVNALEVTRLLKLNMFNVGKILSIFRIL